MLKSESQAEFDALLDGLFKDFRPMGRLEETLVELLGVTLWRQRRLFTVETAEIERGVETIGSDGSGNTLSQVLMAARRRRGVKEPIEKIGDPRVLQTCLDLLTKLELEIEGNSFDPENGKHILLKIYGSSSAGSQLKNLFDDCVKGFIVAESKDRQFTGLEESKREFLRELENEIGRLRRYPEQQAAMESNRLRQMDLESRRRGIPESPRLDQLLRYGTTLERTFDRTLSQLERAQRMRLGQQLLPRIDVSLSS